MKTVILFLKGIAIGIANMIAGVSGGTIAFILGIYENMIDAFASLTKKFWPNFLYLLKIGIGIVFGVLIASKLLKVMFAKLLIETVCFFAFLIIGGVINDLPTLKLDEEEKKSSYKFIIAFIVAFLFIIGITIVNVFVLDNNQSAEQRFDKIDFKTIFILFISMMLGTMAMIFPGISGSLILMVIGIYFPVLNAISDLTHFSNYSEEGFILKEILIIIPMVLGAAVTLLFISKPIKWLFKKYHKICLYVISGFVCASVFSIFILNYDAMVQSFKTLHLMLAIFVFSPLGLGISIGLKQLSIYLENKKNSNLIKEEDNSNV
ncbi:MAG: DUF368 domain-containing protein [Gammaproteobacteria bacterium]|nr:DUF368 domain-containing protein [Gammaproteobacteria bacterium]